ncbi:MAG: thiol:disulfide interchange protein DsbA [Candidatus Azotimanducaceae bacterium]|jgi:thiol:disulfide interchange protein DsbA
MPKRKSRAIVRQQTILGAFGVVALALVGYLTWLTFENTPRDGFVEGQHYQVLEQPRRIRGDKIEVMEFFSYGCIHCFNFEPLITQWAEERLDTVNFIQTPAVANEYWRLLGRTYYALDALNVREDHQLALFRAIHDARLVFDTPDKLASFFDSRGIDRDEFKAAFTSAPVSRNVARADQLARRMQVAAVPTVVVNGKYIVRTSRDVGIKRLLDVIEFLIAKELNEEKAATNASLETKEEAES